MLEAEKGITFEFSEKTSEKLIIRAQNVDRANVYYINYANPPIPERYKHVCGEWNNGFVIERCSDGSQFVWIPVGSLDYNGTLDGKRFWEKFGRRNYMNDKFSDDGFNEALNDELLEQLESVKKYGGFYISRYKNMTLYWNGLSKRKLKLLLKLQRTLLNGAIIGIQKILQEKYLKQEAEKNGVLITSMTLQVMWMNGYKNRMKVHFVLSAVVFATILGTFILLPIAIATILITAILQLVFVPRFILSN